LPEFSKVNVHFLAEAENGENNSESAQRQLGFEFEWMKQLLKSPDAGKTSEWL
jgi:hypothetical protein